MRDINELRFLTSAKVLQGNFCSKGNCFQRYGFEKYALVSPVVGSGIPYKALGEQFLGQAGVTNTNIEELHFQVQLYQKYLWLYGNILIKMSIIRSNEL